MTGTSITKADWETVKRFFSQHPKTIKALYQDSVSKILRTFIRFKSTIVALGKELGQGAFGVVNYAQDEQNREFAVKTENGEINQSDIEELFIAQDLDYAYGITDHQVGTKKEKFKLLKYLDGVDLAFEIYDKYKYFNDHKMEKLNKLTYVQRLIIAIKVCLRLKELQKHRIIHADLKPENIKVKVNGNNIEVYLMDFGFSMRLPSGSTTKIDGCKGTPGYIAPEIYNQAFPSYSQMIFSFESDIYAIGAMFAKDLDLDKSLYEGMVKVDRAQRDSIDTVMNKLLLALETRADLDSDALDFIQSLKPKAPATAAAATLQPQADVNAPDKSGFDPSQIAGVVLKPVAHDATKVAAPKVAVRQMVQLKPVQRQAKEPAAQEKENPFGNTLRAVAKKPANPNAQRPLPAPAQARPADAQPKVQPLVPRDDAPTPVAAQMKAAPKQAPRQPLANNPKAAPKRALPVGPKKAPAPIQGGAQAARQLPAGEPTAVKPNHRLPQMQADAKQQPQAVEMSVKPLERQRTIFVLPGQKPDLVKTAKANLLFAFENQAKEQDRYIPTGAVQTPMALQAPIAFKQKLTDC